jgi:hypothetical protein
MGFGQFSLACCCSTNVCEPKETCWYEDWSSYVPNENIPTGESSGYYLLFGRLAIKSPIHSGVYVSSRTAIEGLYRNYAFDHVNHNKMKLTIGIPFEQSNGWRIDLISKVVDYFSGFPSPYGPQLYPYPNGIAGGISTSVTNISQQQDTQYFPHPLYAGDTVTILYEKQDVTVTGDITDPNRMVKIEALVSFFINDILIDQRMDYTTKPLNRWCNAWYGFGRWLVDSCNAGSIAFSIDDDTSCQ